MADEKGQIKLDYGRPQADSTPPRQTSFGLQLSICVLAVIVGLIAVRIEWLNYAAGTIMPRPASIQGKWRSSSDVSESRWREWNLNGSDALTRQLTSAEQSQWKADSRRELAANSARNWVSTAGLLQYLLVPALLILMVMWASTPDGRRSPRMMLAIFTIFLFAAISLLYRGYFSSLGT